jgi:hypothetical protein
VNALDALSKYGNNVKDVKNDTSKAKAVKTPNKTVGVKLDSAKTENPAAMVVAV